MSVLDAPASMNGDDKYGLLLLTFVGYLMISTKCTKQEALEKISSLCAVAQIQLGEMANGR